ncbi:putative Strictosidine synthase [Quillaja saponaria]|uniref:Strictosidine synthase n=1 Tax=Quillaja saponaria TaxID=32244 RepID=A0AAD7KYQ6_QUISA|nr:putative Strictosidine synthase [Quillaja saponaria]
MTPFGVLTLLFFLLALYCGLDPFKHSAISDFPDFKTYKVDMPAWSQLPTERDTENLLQKSEIKFSNQIQGPESTAFDPLGRGPYVGVADGRILFWNGQSWTDFAYTSSNRADRCQTRLSEWMSELCDPKPSPLSYLKNEHICGRPLGLRFDKKTGDLYIADAYFGLMKVGPEGGLATSLTTEAEGVPFRFTNGLDIDGDGNVYFTDSSSNYQRRNFMHLIFSGENSGRVLKYNPVTKETAVLVRGVQFPNGVSLSKDVMYFDVASVNMLSFLAVYLERFSSITSLWMVTRHIWLRKYWLKGEKAGTSEVFSIVHGFPDNVRTNEDGDFWVAIHSRRSMYTYICALYPKVSKFLLKLPIPAKIHFLLHTGGRPHAVAAKYSPEGKLLQLLEDNEGKVVKAISEVEEKDGKLWMGSVLMPFIAVYELP